MRGRVLMAAAAMCARVARAVAAGRSTIVAEPLELFVGRGGAAPAGLARARRELNGRPDDPEGAGWQAEIEQAQEQLDELAAMWGSKEISRSEWLKARATIQQRQDIGPQTTRRAQPHLRRCRITSGTRPGCGSGGQG